MQAWLRNRERNVGGRERCDCSDGGKGREEWGGLTEIRGGHVEGIVFA